MDVTEDEDAAAKYYKPTRTTRYRGADDDDFDEDYEPRARKKRVKDSRQPRDSIEFKKHKSATKQQRRDGKDVDSEAVPETMAELQAMIAKQNQTPDFNTPSPPLALWNQFIVN